MILTRFQTPMPALRRLAGAVAVAALAACSGDDFDATQVPRITITPVVSVPVVTIAWEPAGAQQVQVYRGTVADGNSTSLVWSISGTGTNSLVSGVEYGASVPVGGTTLVPAQPLVPGQPYTVQVSRVDPRNASGSVSGGRFRYQSTQTFTIAAIVTPP
jgi:hypothetical protein